MSFNIKNIAKKIKQIQAKTGLDSFVIGIIGVIILAYFWWQPGVYEGKVTLNDIGNIGVSLIFFFYGLKLSPQELKKGLSNWKLHIVVQTATFIIFPIVVLVFMAIFGSFGNKLLWLGIFISTSGGDFDLTNVIIKLSLQVLLPVAIGVLLHPKFGKIALKNSNKLRIFDQSIILLIVYVSFCDSFANKMFSGYATWELIVLGLAMIALFFIIYGIVTFIGKLLKFSIEDHITAVFCGSKKSLVHGTVMSKVLFPGIAGVGVILLPLMIFHALQLVLASMLAQKFAKRPDK